MQLVEMGQGLNRERQGSLKGQKNVAYNPCGIFGWSSASSVPLPSHQCSSSYWKRTLPGSHLRPHACLGFCQAHISFICILWSQTASSARCLSDDPWSSQDGNCTSWKAFKGKCLSLSLELGLPDFLSFISWVKLAEKKKNGPVDTLMMCCGLSYHWGGAVCVSGLGVSLGPQFKFWAHSLACI